MTVSEFPFTSTSAFVRLALLEHLETLPIAVLPHAARSGCAFLHRFFFQVFCAEWLFTTCICLSAILGPATLRYKSLTVNLASFVP